MLRNSRARIVRPTCARGGAVVGSRESDEVRRQGSTGGHSVQDPAACYERTCGVADHRRPLQRAAGGLELPDVVLERRREIVACHLVVKREKCGQHDSGIGNLVRRKQRGELSIPLELPNAVSVDKEHMVDSHSLFLLLLQRRLVATAQCPVPVSRDRRSVVTAGEARPSCAV